MNRPPAAHLSQGLMLVALFAADVAPATAPSTARSTSSPVQRASCVIRIETDGDRTVPTVSVLRQLEAALTSTALLDPAAKAALGLEAEQWPTAIQLEIQPAGDSALKVVVIAKPTSDVPVATGAAAMMLNEVTRRLLVAYDSTSDSDAGDDRRSALLRQRREIDAKVQAIQEQLTTAMRSNVTANNPNLDPRTVLERERDDATSELDAQTALIAAIDGQLKDLPESKPELAATRAKLIDQRVQANLSVARAQTRMEQVQKRVAALPSPATNPTPVNLENLQTNLRSLSEDRNVVEAAIRDLSTPRQRPPGKVRLVAVTGESK